jgi:phosphoribosylformylglycinamidine cyclo-ligase
VANSNDSKDQLNYKDSGVDIDAGNRLVDLIKPVVKTTTRPEVMTGLGGFGGMFQLDTSRYRQPVLVSGTDGVGTKLMLARQLGIHDSIGIDLVAMCVNDILCCGAEPLFFLDYFATGKLNPEQAKEVISGIAEGCLQSGCALVGGETAEMPGMYDGEEYDLAGFTVGAVERDEILDGSRVEAGHIILGLPSSGPHSNGYSLIRKVLQRSGADPAMPLESGSEQTLGHALIAPTRIYVKPVLELLKGGGVDALAHITGGGITENIVRVIPDHLGLEIDLSSWSLPPVFQWVQKEGNIAEEEMLRTFNCGIGLALLVSPEKLESVQQALTGLGEQVINLGRVTVKGEQQVRYSRS